MRPLTKTQLCLRIGALALFICLLFYLYHYFASLGMNYEWQWNRSWRYLGRWTSDGFKAGPLLDGILLTLGITALGMIFSFWLGLALAVMRLSPWSCCIGAAKIYVTIFRNTPLLLQLFFVYFLVAPLFKMGPFESAVLTLSAFEGAYVAEIFRGALLGIDKTQWEASLSLGFSLPQALRLVILPQALRKSLPAFTNQAVALIKDTSLVSAIAVADITMQAQAIVADTFMAFEVWLIVALIYLLITLCVSLPGLWLERRHAWH